MAVSYTHLDVYKRQGMDLDYRHLHPCLYLPALALPDHLPGGCPGDRQLKMGRDSNLYRNNPRDSHMYGYRAVWTHGFRYLRQHVLQNLGIIS